MTDVTIKTLAAERQTSVERLVQQFADAGIRKSADDSVSAQEKQTLIDHLNHAAPLTFLVPVEKANRYKSKSARNAPL